MLNIRYFVFLIFLDAYFTEVISKENRVLSRKKRYLMFPEGSNFVITMSYVKSLMKEVPKGINVLGECDVPFKLPSDTRLLRRRYHAHYRHRREIYSQLELAFNSHGLDGNACVKRMICEVEQFTKTKKKSLVKDLISAIFSFQEANFYEDSNFTNACHSSTFISCTIPVLNLILGSFT